MMNSCEVGRRLATAVAPDGWRLTTLIYTYTPKKERRPQVRKKPPANFRRRHKLYQSQSINDRQVAVGDGGAVGGNEQSGEVDTVGGGGSIQEAKGLVLIKAKQRG